ncbi:MFS transporter [Variovorax ginsengisoli]|uniref:MFS family arabinose efflux permease n=1 Tax=Variovorax ginsengisoli TaxID=363844 RepID=A0ABT9S9S8_9BURK|nr:MFS transporter [Variovorax ginsengisoli]MDP9901120.1 putative MFS family arabinose efflux permease [Variovorax ginsengisoli]
MITTNSLRGRIALMTGHCAGMVDLVALPVWVGTLMSAYRFDPQQAGLLATLFLVGAVVSSLVLAPFFQRLHGRTVATMGFSCAAVGFAAAATTTDFDMLALLHLGSGLAAGAALSVTHGTIARSPNPHRLFAWVGIALGFFAIAFLGVAPSLVAIRGGPVLFQVFAGVMAVGALAALLAFPVPDLPDSARAKGAPAAPLPVAIWWGVLGIAGMGLVQSMTFSFLERVGSDRGFGMEAVMGVLIALGVVNLFPAALAAVLEKRWPARKVLVVGPAVQALLVVVMMNSPVFAPYAVAAAVFAAVMIFTHTFAFGVLARLDPSGRALAATPAMLMFGAAIGPILGGTLVKGWGYGSIGVAALVIDGLAVSAFACVHRARRAPRAVGAVHGPSASDLP